MAYTDKVVAAADAFTAAADAVAAAADAVTAAADAVITQRSRGLGSVQMKIRPTPQIRRDVAPTVGSDKGPSPKKPKLPTFQEDTARQDGRSQNGVKRDATIAGLEAADDLTRIHFELTAIRRLLEKLVANSAGEVFATNAAGRM